MQNLHTDNLSFKLHIEETINWLKKSASGRVGQKYNLIEQLSIETVTIIVLTLGHRYVFIVV